MASRTKSKRNSNRPRVSKRKRSTKRRRFTKPARIPSDDRLEIAVGLLREGRSQKRSAEIAGVKVSRFRRFLRVNKLAHFRNGSWRITDRRQREITVISEGQKRLITVRGFNPASLAMRHRAAVKQFFDSNDVVLLAPFNGQTVTDTAKQKHVLETRPNVLLRLANAGNDAEMKIYRLID